VNKNLEIQSLRGYAIVLTIIAHFGTLLPQLNPYLGYFWLGGGVDLFFCISGFVIARSLLNKKRVSFIGFIFPFIIKRFYRLWPAAIFWSLFVLACSAIFNASGVFATFEQNFITAIAAWFQVVNFKIVSCAFLEFSECSGGSPLRIYWSLSLEEQFYLVLPTMLFFFGNKKVALIAAVFFVVQFFLHRPWPSPLWFFRTDAICLGVIIAWCHHEGYARLAAPTYLENKIVRGISSFSLCALLFLVAKLEIVWFFNGLVALVAGLLVYIASFDRGYFLRQGYLLKITAFIGERSYSMYLTHLISFVLVKGVFYKLEVYSREGVFAIYLALAAWVGIFILSEFSYRFIEILLREKGRIAAENKNREIQRVHQSDN